MRDMNLRRIMFDPILQSWAAISLTVVLLALTGTFFLIPAVQRSQEDATRLQLITANQAADLLSLDLATLFAQMQRFGGDMLSLRDVADRRNVSDSFLAAFGFDSFTLIDRNGAMLVAADDSGLSSPSSNSFADTLFFKKAVAGDVYVSPVYIGPSGPVLRISAPVKKGNDIVAVASGELKVELLWRVANIAQVEGGKIYIVDENGTIVSDSDLERARSGENLAYRDVVGRLLKGESPVLLSSYMNERKVPVIASGIRMPQTGWSIVVEQPRAQVLRARDQTTRTALGFLAASLALIAMLVLVTRRLTHANVQLRRDRAVIESQRNTSEQVISGVTDAVIALDVNRRIIIFNPAAELLTGNSTREVLGKEIGAVLSLFDEERRISSTMYAPLGSGMYAKHGMRALTSRGEAFVDIIASAVPSHSQSDVACIMTIRDITADRRLEKLKTDFVAVAAHQLRTPLTGIRWTFSLALEGSWGALTEMQRENIGKAAKTTDALIKIVNDMLNVDVFESDHLTFSKQPTDLYRLVQTVLEDTEMPAAAKKIGLALQPYHECTVDVDPKQTIFAIRNLIENSIKYTLEGGAIRLALREDGSNVVVEIADTGIGIPKGEQEHIFRRFFRASNAARLEPSGSGLGLYLVKAIVEKQGGRVWFESEEGKGATFFVSFPAIPAAKKGAEPKGSSLPEEKAGGKI